MDGLGCTPANGNVPSRHLFPPPLASLERSGKSSTLRAPQSELGKTPPEPPWARPPKPGGLGWIWALRQDSPLHRDRAWGAGWSYQTRTHAPAARLREKASSANPLLAAQTPTVSPWHAGQCLQLKAPPPTRRGGYRG